jgi:hypothetical protein
MGGVHPCRRLVESDHGGSALLCWPAFPSRHQARSWDFLGPERDSNKGPFIIIIIKK